MANKITTILDIEDKGFRGALKSIGSAVGEADGFMGKFKAGASAGLNVVKENAAAFAVAGGTALVAFGVKAVHAFEDTAKAAIDLSKATGLSIEDASRWIGVGKDYGVGADQLVSSIGKIAKTLDSGKWEQYGIATRDASGHARDANAILEDSLVRLSSITNETERATMGNALFGKGFANLAPLVGHTREEYDQMLGSVEKGQVITDAEAAKAEKMRLAEDKLKDSLHEVMLAVGGLVAALAPLISLLADLTNGISTVINDISNMNTSFTDGAADSKVFKDAIQKVKDVHDGLAGSVRNSQNSLEGYSYAAGSAKDTVDSLTRSNQSMTDDLKRGLNADKVAMDRLLGVVNDDEAWLNLQDQFDAVNKKMADGEQGTRDYQRALDELKKQVIDYGTAVLGLPTEQVTAIYAEVNPQSLADAQNLLDILTRNRTMDISIVTKGGAGYGTATGAPHAAGGPVSAGVAYPVGEKGPETFVPDTNGTIVPNGGGGDGGPVTINVYPPVGSNPNEMVKLLEKHVNRNGIPNFLLPVGGVSGGKP